MVLKHIPSTYSVIMMVTITSIPTKIIIELLHKMEKESKSVGLENKDAMNQARWRVGVRKIADKVG